MERIEFIAVGREVLDGRVIDTNSSFMAQVMKQKGHVARFAQRVGDVMDEVIDAFQVAEARSDFIVVTGGLGPTVDDLTAEAFARYKGVALASRPEAVAQIQARFRSLGRELDPKDSDNLKQAFLPVGARILENPAGTAPGFSWEKDGSRWFFLPGVPKEMRAMLWQHVIAALSENAAYKAMHWATQFTRESELQARIRKQIGIIPPQIEVIFRTRFPENHVGLEMIGHGELGGEFDRLCGEMDRLLAPETFSRASRAEELAPLERVVIEAARSRKARVLTVESCTGGLVAKRLTDISGSSEVVWGGFVTYDDLAKESLGVDPALIAKHGAVSEPVAKAMAEAGRYRAIGAGLQEVEVWSVSLTGIAGPTGGTPEKPVGLCHVAVAGPGGLLAHVQTQAPALRERDENRLYFSQRALDLLWRQLKL
ncbi:MAG TPA: nicotinamide-nucleotide amidohydrolase family protein [Bdellovibrionota bacterium]|jgi:nicotinamide-nucleotide amidase|nr:nicotinamide-nucleotide amidohydrolase family protein [Bdellovibrionota bacterium]